MKRKQEEKYKGKEVMKTIVRAPMKRKRRWTVAQIFYLAQQSVRNQETPDPHQNLHI